MSKELAGDGLRVGGSGCIRLPLVGKIVPHDGGSPARGMRSFHQLLRHGAGGLQQQSGGADVKQREDVVYEDHVVLHPPDQQSIDTRQSMLGGVQRNLHVGFGAERRFELGFGFGLRTQDVRRYLIFAMSSDAATRFCLLPWGIGMRGLSCKSVVEHNAFDEAQETNGV
eukprot:scaffold771_cov236-Pinguiococcus_pyrenoidosus.AAC.2